MIFMVPSASETLTIGDRDGGLLYRLSTRAGAFALTQHEAIAVDWISLAIRDADPDLAADIMVSGATWLATQSAWTASCW